jgi:zinc and cadmium transporter
MTCENSLSQLIDDSALDGSARIGAQAIVSLTGLGITKIYQASLPGFSRESFMPEYAWLALFSVLIGLFALLGGLLPFRGEISHTKLQFYLTASAGVMLGAAAFHVMPDAIEKSGKVYSCVWMVLAIVGLFCIERFIAPHSHEVDDNHHAENGGETHVHHEHEGVHGHSHAPLPEHRAAAPAVAGWMAVLGLTIHTFMNGVGLAGSVEHDLSKSIGFLGIPGFAMFMAVLIHKPADALAISTVLTRKRVERWKITWVQLGYVSMIPIGAFAFSLTSGALGESLQNQLTGFALGFSAGTFIFIALSDLLPEVQFHRHDRVPLTLTLLLGLLLMAGIAWLEDLAEDKEKDASAKPVAAVRNDRSPMRQLSTPEMRSARKPELPLKLGNGS